MKKVVFKKAEVSVFIDNVENEDLIGIQWKSEVKGIVVEVQGGYCILNNDSIHEIGAVRNPSKRNYIKDRLYNGDVKEVFVFDSYKELLKWFTS